MPLSLNEVVEVLLTVDDDINVWYDRKADALKWHSPYSGDIDDEGAQTNADECVNLPSRYEINDYHLMELYIDDLEQGEAKRALADSIIGRGAFRRFRGTAERFNLLDDWYAFRKACYVNFARRWCEVNGIEYLPYITNDQNFKEPDFDLYDDEAFHVTLASQKAQREKKEEKAYTVHEAAGDEKKKLAPIAADETELARDDAHVFVIDGDGEPAGFIVIEDSETPKVLDLFVNRKYRRQGVGEALVRAAEKNYGALLIRAVEPDAQSVKFLNKCGYRVEAMDFVKK